MGTFETFRKAYGALKDSTMVGLAKVNSEYKDLDIAIVKATNHVECPPKERHVRIYIKGLCLVPEIFSATSVSRPRADVAYCIHALARRLSKTRNWIVALKTLIVIHRTLREGDPTFREDLLNYSHRGHVLQISNFKDDSSPLAWDCSAWVRTYALFLEERLECFRILKYDVETERLTKTPQGSKSYSRTRLLNSEELLEQLPALQQLLYRLIGCQPEGGAFHNYLIQYALALVLKESFKIYCAINDGIINLVDMFFDMTRHDAVKALNIYKRAGQQAQSLADFYEFCKGLDLARNFQFPQLRQPPPSFLATMEEYIREAPQTGSVSNKRLVRNLCAFKDFLAYNICTLLPSNFHDSKTQSLEVSALFLVKYDLFPKYIETDKVGEPEKPEETGPPEEDREGQGEEGQSLLDAQEEAEAEPEHEKEVEPAQLISTDTNADLLGLSDQVNPHAAELEETNALALAIIQPGQNQTNRGPTNFSANTTGWELALVTAPSNNTGHITDSKMGGGFDRLLLDSLYEDDSARRQIQMQNAGYGAYGMMMQNPFEQQHDPFAMSNNMAPPTHVQLAMQQQQQQQQHLMMLQQQQLQQQQLMLGPPQQHFPQYPQMQKQQMGPSNPFGDPFNGLSQNTMPNRGNHGLI
ncbi:AP180 N-terminal homology (ANTH) domain [Dillenia turbinata]|uniref:AP180 N-terminal homology (ANTH) domain n=1 Tax=Dillenia turbinata TaxID=194707 RepID=A0AAN8ZLK9_9MAGN